MRLSQSHRGILKRTLCKGRFQEKEKASSPGKMEINFSGNIIFIILKAVEILFVLIAIAIYQSRSLPWTLATTIGGQFFGDGSLFMSIIITPLILITGILGEKRGSIFELAINVITTVFLLATGSLIIDTNRLFGLSDALATGSMCIIGSFVYLGDCIYTFMAMKNSE